MMLEVSAVPIVIENDDEDVGIEGTGVLFATDRAHYLVTAAHVASDFRKHPHWYGIPMGRGTPTESVETVSFGHGQLALTDPNTPDVAVFKFGNAEYVERLKTSGRRFLRRENLAQGQYSVFELFGWPRSQARRDGFAIKAQPTWLQTRLYPGPDTCNPETELLLDWVSKVDYNLEGISGCPVWVKTVPGEGVWEPSQAYHLAGIQTGVLERRWIKMTKWIVVDNVIREIEARST